MAWLHDYGSLALTFWARVVQRGAVVVVLIALAASALALKYTVDNLGVETDIDKMLSSELPFRQTYDRFQRLFPQFKDNIVVVLEGDTPEQASAAATALAERLAADDAFRHVEAPQENPFLVDHGLLYLDADALQDLSNRLAEVQPFLGRLTRHQSLRGLFGMLQAALEAKQSGQRVELDPILGGVDRAITSTLAGEPFTLSWQELIAAGAAPSDAEATRRFVIVRPRLDPTDLQPAGKAVDRLREHAARLGIAGPGPVRMALTGDVMMSYEEIGTLGQDAELIAGLSLAMVTLALAIGLRSVRLVLGTVLALLVGLALTAAFATAAIGHLNLISVAFAVLYVGLGVDYAIHLALRYQELIGHGFASKAAVVASSRGVGASLVACAITTAISFYAFVPTSYAGVSELGLISGSSMFISVAVTLTLLPALFALAPLHRAPQWHRRLAAPLVERVRDVPLHHAGVVLATTAVVTVVALLLLPQVRFDYNPLNLRDPESESVATFAELLRTSETPPWAINVLADGADEAQHLADDLRALPETGRVVTLQDFVPEHQDEKLAILQDMALLLGPELGEDGGRPEPEPAKEVAAIEDLRRTLEERLGHGVDVGAAARTLETRLGALLGALESAEPERRDALLSTLRDSLLATLPINLERLQRQLLAERVTLDDLPPSLVSDWVAPDGTHRVEAFPAIDLGKPGALQRFVGAVRTAAPNATDAPVTMLESGRAVIGAFQEAFVLSLFGTTLVLLVLLRSLRDSLLMLVPLLLGGVLTGAVMVVADIPFNFANVIALPLLLGLGVDNGIHIVHRARSRAIGDTANPLRTSTARGMVFSGITTVCSFGNLTLSSHPGMMSMGQVLAIGTVLTMICSLVVLPALLSRLRPPATETAS